MPLIKAERKTRSMRLQRRLLPTGKGYRRGTKNDNYKKEREESRKRG